jgi:radical SAM superfamily enzyme YgiQ (UPF0313 family)
MKVLLINPHFEVGKFGRFCRFFRPMPCLGLAYIAAVLKKNNFEVEALDSFALRIKEAEVLEIVKEKKPRLVGISCLTPSMPIALSIVRKIKEYDRDITIALGNIHASFFAEKILAGEGVDVVVHGEGEYAMSEVAEAVCSNKNFDQIKGISFKADGKIIKTTARDLLEDLDSLPYPAWHLFSFEKYGFLPFADIYKPALSILTSRGCPYHCSFCSLPNIKSKYRKRSAEKVVDEIDSMIKRFQVRQIGFVDPIFSLTKEDGLRLCQEMIRRNLGERVVWLCETRVDLMDRELLQAMKKAGCRRILYGIETGNQEILDKAKKNFNLNSIKKTVKDTKDAGIHAVGLFMLGFPGETKEMMQRTINFAREIDLDFAKFALTIPFPGSQLYDELTRSGKLKRQDWENFIPFNSDPKKLVCVTERIKPEELIHMQKKAHFEFYLRPKIIFRHLVKIRTIRLKDLLFGFLSLLLPWEIRSK